MRSRQRAVADLESVTEYHWRVTGALALETVPELWKRKSTLLAPGRHVTCDLAGVERTDSAGLALLVSLLREARASETTLQFANIPDQLRSLARLSGVDGLLPQPGR